MTTDQDYLHFEVCQQARQLFRHRLRHLVNPVAGIASGFVLGAALFILTVQLLFGIPLSIPAIAVAVAALAYYLIALVRARAASAAQGPQTLVFTDGGVAVTDAAGTAAYPWHRFQRWLESDHDFVLTSGGWRGRILVVVPKGDIAEDDQTVLREVLHAYIDPNDEPLQDAFVEMDWHEQPARRAPEEDPVEQ